MAWVWQATGKGTAPVSARCRLGKCATGESRDERGLTGDAQAGHAQHAESVVQRARAKLGRHGGGAAKVPHCAAVSAADAGVGAREATHWCAGPS